MQVAYRECPGPPGLRQGWTSTRESLCAGYVSAWLPLPLFIPVGRFYVEGLVESGFKV